MGSGLSLTHKQVAEIIKRDLIKEFNIKQANKCPYTNEGVLIYEDFIDEEILCKKIKELYQFINFGNKKIK